MLELTPLTTATPQTDPGELHEVLIVGSGPAGYTAAMYAARANLAPVVSAGAVTAGGAPVNTPEVEHLPGCPDGLRRPGLMDQMQAQAEKFGATGLYDDATSVDLAGEVKTVTTAEGHVYLARAVILANGSAYKELGLDGESEMTGRGVSYCATCDEIGRAHV